MKLLSRYVSALRLGAQIDQINPANKQSALVPLYETITMTNLGASTTSLTAFLNDSLSGSFQLVGVSANFGVTSTSGTLQVEVATGTQAVAAGTNQLTGTMSLGGTANVPVNGTIIASPTTIAAGSRVNLIFAGTMTNLANCSITLVLRRIAT